MMLDRIIHTFFSQLISSLAYQCLIQLSEILQSYHFFTPEIFVFHFL